MIARPKKKERIKDVLKSGGIPGYLLIGYYLVQAVFARGKLDAAAIDASALIFMLYSFICLGVGGYYLFIRKGRQRNYQNFIFIHTPLKWFLLYTVLGFISALWSLQVSLTLYRALECITMLLLMMGTMKELFKYNLKRVIEWSIYYIFFTIIIRSLQYIASGSALTISKGGVFQSAQMIATIFFFLGIFHARKWYMKYTIAAFAILSLSTTGYIGMALGIISLAFGNAKYKIATFFIGICILIAISFLGTDKLLKNTVFIDRSEISVENTSGRDQVWNLGFEWIKERPFTGYGFVAGETYLVRVKEERTQVIGMHNSFMSALVDEGVFGFVFMLLFFLGMFRVTFSRYIPIQYRPALIACFIGAFVHSMGNPGIGFRVYGSWMSAMYVCVLLCSIYVQNKYYRPKPLRRIIAENANV